MKSKKKNLIIFFLLGIFFILWGSLMYFIGPERVVEFIGVENSYLLMFFIAFFGGISTLTAPSFYTTLITLALGGLDPLALALVAGLGNTINDSVFFYFGVKGRESLSGKWLKYTSRLREWFASHPSWIPPIAVFLYTGFTPLPNDPLMIALALAHIRFRTIVLSIFLGSTTLAFLVATVVGV